MSKGNATLREIGDGAFAYLQRDGWGFSNAGLITSAGASLGTPVLATALQNSAARSAG